MTVAEVRAWLASLPLEQQPRAREALTCLYDDGFYTGAAKLPRKTDPMGEPEQPAEKRKR